MTTVVVPLTATFTADGTANLKQVMQEEVSPLVADYDIYISASGANDVFKAFSIAEGTSDASADVIVSVVSGNESIVKAALKAALEAAVGGAAASSGAGGALLKALMQAYVKQQVESDLASSGLFNILEAEELINVDIPNTDIGDAGSVAMWNVLAAQTPGNNNALLNVIATQLPYEQYADISGGGNLDAAFAVGDKLVFNFTINTTLNVTPEEEDQTGPLAGGFSATDAPASAQAAFNSAQKSRTFNLHVTKTA